MVQAQGLRPFDPYRILQLDPHAPRELIVEAYWALVSRSRRGERAGEDGVRRTDEMSAAYGSLVDAARRRAVDLSMGVDAAAGAKRRRNAEYYETLCVDPEADGRIIELAHQLLSRDEQRKRRSVRQFVLDEAYRTLSNPLLRAQYDLAREQAPERPRPALVPVETARRSSKKGAESRGGFLGLRRRGDAALETGDVRLLTLRDSAVRWDVAQSESLSTPGNSADAPAELVIMAGPHAGRRLALGEHPISMGGTLRDDLLLDAGLPAEAILVWHHGERSMLKHALGAGVTIGGAPPALSIIVLEDGDEIAIAGHEMRYRRIPGG